MSRPIYLDYNATTPVDPAVADAMQPYLHDAFGNPSSAHAFGVHAKQAVDRARRQVAELIGAAPGELVFTGCATEANNLALLGVARALVGRKRHLVISAVEHPAVNAPAAFLATQGWELSIVPVDSTGRVDPAAVAAAMREDTALVSIMHANNEVGTIQPVREIAGLAHARGVLCHTDAAQSVGKIPVNVAALDVDLLSLAGHKFYATKGVGALYVRPGTEMDPVLFGAGHERGLRPGTENVPAIVGLGQAAVLAKAHLESSQERVCRLRDRLHARLDEGIDGLVLNGHREERLPNTLHVSFPGITGRELLARASDTVAASVGSACHSEHDAVSGVLAAMGCDATRAAGAVRLSVGRMTTTDEVDRAARSLVDAWRGN
jgi:cysteine desulfurase